jgi:hypothetical protein
MACSHFKIAETKVKSFNQEGQWLQTKARRESQRDLEDIKAFLAQLDPEISIPPKSIEIPSLCLSI